MNCDIETAKSRLESYFDEISNMMANDRCHIKTAFACGICALPENVTDINTLQPSVANAMQEAFAMNTVLTEIVEYSDELSEKVRRNEKIKGDLYKAVENHELLVEIQPKYNMETGVVSSAEALVRWVHPELGKIYPDDFIPYAERTGEIIDIDMCVLEEVCRHMRKWMDEGYNVVPVAVNQSRLHIADPNYAASVFRMMQKYDVWPNMIMLETTESIAFSDYNDVTEILRQLHSYGFILSMDDFGSGYSSLNMLNELEYDELKLDMKLVRKCNDDERSKTIIRHIISMAHDLNMKVVAEGVETKEQLEALRDAGCDVAQGFYYAKPMSIENFEASVFGRIAPEE